MTRPGRRPSRAARGRAGVHCAHGDSGASAPRAPARLSITAASSSNVSILGQARSPSQYESAVIEGHRVERGRVGTTQRPSGHDAELREHPAVQMADVSTRWIDRESPTADGETIRVDNEGTIEGSSQTTFLSRSAPLSATKRRCADLSAARAMTALSIHSCSLGVIAISVSERDRQA
jgi:hypothetical protein